MSIPISAAITRALRSLIPGIVVRSPIAVRKGSTLAPIAATA
ncbi:MAG: hypothetical protein ACT4O2_09280 [Beijerinckiaceae bacterium]